MSEMKALIEALLFASHEPVSIGKLREVVEGFGPIETKQLRQLLMELKEEYISSSRGFQLEEIAGGFLLRTKQEYGQYVQQLLKSRKGERLSPAASELLAIVAYKQPVTRPQIEAIRGVDSSGPLAALVERGLVEAKGKLEAPGRPSLYRTTSRFLQLLGLKSLSHLPAP